MDRSVHVFEDIVKRNRKCEYFSVFATVLTIKNRFNVAHKRLLRFYGYTTYCIYKQKNKKIKKKQNVTYNAYVA